LQTWTGIRQRCQLSCWAFGILFRICQTRINHFFFAVLLLYASRCFDFMRCVSSEFFRGLVACANHGRFRRRSHCLFTVPQSCCWFSAVCSGLFPVKGFFRFLGISALGSSCTSAGGRLPHPPVYLGLCLRHVRPAVNSSRVVEASALSLSLLQIASLFPQ
jgi:hypothetical protein